MLLVLERLVNVCDLPEKDQTGMVQVNCTALTAVTTMVLPFMPQTAVSCSLPPAQPFASACFFAVYAASKAYVLSYSWALNRELKSRKIFVDGCLSGTVRQWNFDIAQTTQAEISLYKKLA